MNFKIDKGRVKVGKYSLSSLALAEVFATILFGVLTIVLGISAYKDARTYYAWNSALRLYASNMDPSADLEIARSHRPEFVPVHELIAKIAVNTGNLDLARQECETIQKLDPASEAAAVTLGIVALKTYDKTKQEPLLAQAKSHFSSAGASADAKVGMGHVLLRQGDLEGAWKSFEAALQSDPPASLDAMSDLYIGQAAIQVKRQNSNAARESFERALVLAPQWDRGYANKAYLMARQMAEMPPMEREKFRKEVPAWNEFADRLGTAYNQNKEGRAYYKDAILTYLDAYACLAIRSLDHGTAAAKFNQISGVDAGAKRPTINYLATIATVIYNRSLMSDERGQFVHELANQSAAAFSRHKDLTWREKAVLYQLMTVHSVITGADLESGDRNAEKALEAYQSSGAEDHLKAMIYRAKAAGLARQLAFKNEQEKVKLVEDILKAGDQSLQAEDQPDLREWLKKFR
ncbi:MAG: hypothetical protein IT452_18700 [Planctomycetia bacterium]|nr:hypothetical protein [Planctomycetia bacterium]